jgi:phage terminase small subunit
MSNVSLAKTLTPKQNLFISEYLANGMNASKAAISAGYSESSAGSIGSENLTKPEIVAEIDKRLERRAKRLGADADYVINTIMSVIEKCNDSDSELYDPQAVLKGAELIGKTLKLFTDKLEIEGDAVKITNVLLNI